MTRGVIGLGLVVVVGEGVKFKAEEYDYDLTVDGWKYGITMGSINYNINRNNSIYLSRQHTQGIWVETYGTMAWPSESVDAFEDLWILFV